jgi:glycosyltransferase involved in cell wall biosynthesis
VKVLFLNPIATLGGAEHGLLDIIAALRRHSPEFQMEVLTLEDGPLLSEAATLGASTDVLRLPRELATLGESGPGGQPSHGWLRNAKAAAALSFWFPRLGAVLRRKRANVLHSNGLKTHLLAAVAKPAALPLIWHIHDFVSERRLTARLLPRLQRRVACALAISQAVAEDAQPLFRSLRVETILNGIQTDLFAPGCAAAVDLDALAGLGPAPSGAVRIGLVATYASWKGHDVFLEAARKVDRAQARFYVVGGPVYSTTGSQVSESELRAKILALNLEGRCGLVPFQRDIAGVFAALDVVVQASTRREPFGRTVAEAMASGRTVIAPAFGGILEQIRDGESGLLFRPGSSEALAAALVRAIDSEQLRSELSQRALSAARLTLDHRRMAPRLATLYAELSGLA